MMNLDERELAPPGPRGYSKLRHTMQEIHGHEVMQFMIASGNSFTRESLREAIIGKFGAEARFHTCSSEGMDADGIIQFLEERGKFVAVDGGFTTDPSKICNH